MQTHFRIQNRAHLPWEGTGWGALNLYNLRIVDTCKIVNVALKNKVCGSVSKVSQFFLNTLGISAGPFQYGAAATVPDATVLIFP